MGFERNTSKLTKTKKATQHPGSALVLPLLQHFSHFTTRLLWLLSSKARATSSFHLHLSLPRGFVWRVYFRPPQSDQKYL